MRQRAVNIADRHRSRSPAVGPTARLEAIAEQLGSLEDRLFSLRQRIAQFQWAKNLSADLPWRSAQWGASNPPLDALTESLAAFRHVCVGLVSELSELEQELTADRAISADEQEKNG
jgi:hypothetical protein